MKSAFAWKSSFKYCTAAIYIWVIYIYICSGEHYQPIAAKKLEGYYLFSKTIVINLKSLLFSDISANLSHIQMRKHNICTQIQSESDTSCLYSKLCSR